MSAEIAPEEKAYINALFSFSTLPVAFKLSNQILIMGAFVGLWMSALMGLRFVSEADTVIGRYLLEFFCQWAWLIWVSYASFRWFADDHVCYRVLKHEVSLKKGWITNQLITTPVKRIQHIEVNQGLIDQFFQHGELKILSAGHCLKIRGLPVSEAENIRLELLAIINGEKNG